MKVDYSEESSVKKALHFEIEPEVVDKEIAERSKHYASRVKLPGFRPGKVPAHVIRQRFRQQVLEDVAEKIVNKVVRDELEGRGLRPVATPRVTELKIDDNQPMTFKAEFEILPLVDLPDYKGLPVKSREATVAEADVDKEIDRLRQEAARNEVILEEFRERENALRNTLLTAQRLADQIKENAETEAKTILREAESRADMLLQKSQGRLTELDRDINEMRLRRRDVEGSLEASIASLSYALDFMRTQDHQSERDEKLLLHRPKMDTSSTTGNATAAVPVARPA